MVKSKPQTAECTAIVGMACRVAGANSPSKLWDNIINKVDLQQTIPKERFNIDGFYHPNGPNKGTVSYIPTTKLSINELYRQVQNMVTLLINLLIPSTRPFSGFQEKKPKRWTLNSVSSSKSSMKLLKMLA
jgi:hypothetical protein